jgi:hypothetical protein
LSGISAPGIKSAESGTGLVAPQARG